MFLLLEFKESHVFIYFSLIGINISTMQLDMVNMEKYIKRKVSAAGNVVESGCQIITYNMNYQSISSLQIPIKNQFTFM